MSKKQNALSTVAPWDMVAAGYTETTMKFLAPYSESALKLAELDPSSRVLDVACGPGTLSLLAARHVGSVHAIDFSKEMTAIFRDKIRASGITNVEIMRGDGQKLPYSDYSFDAAFSMFGLMFFPDRSKGYSEIHRTLRPGGRIFVSSWAPVAQSPAMRVMFGAIKAMKPEIPEPQTDIESLENPELFRRELIGVGFNDVTVRLVTKELPITSIESFWSDMVQGSAPIAMLKNSMSPDEWLEKEMIALDYLGGVLDPMPASLASDAWLGSGRK